MPYQVSFKSKSGKRRMRTTDAYRLKSKAQSYAGELNAFSLGEREARVVIAKKGTYDRIV